MVETCRKLQMTYLSSMESVQLVGCTQESTSSSNENDILIRVTSAPQNDSKGHYDLLINEDNSTEESTHSLAEPTENVSTNRQIETDDERTINNADASSVANDDTATVASKM